MSYETYILSQIRKSTSYQTKCRIIMRTSNTRCNLNCRISDNFSNDSFSTRVFLNRQIPNTIFSQTTFSQHDGFSNRRIINGIFINFTTVSQISFYKTAVSQIFKTNRQFLNLFKQNDSFSYISHISVWNPCLVYAGMTLFLRVGVNKDRR